MERFLNIADRLRTSAELCGLQRAVVFPQGRDYAGRVSYTHLTFRQLDDEATRIARGLVRMGVRPGHRIVLMVRPSLEFIALTFGIFRSGAVATLIDPGMGRSSVFKCLDEVNPDGFVAIPPVHAIRRLMLGRYRNSRFNVIVGKSPLRFGCSTYAELVSAGDDPATAIPQTRATDQAAIIFTSGSTGPPKGVVYEHGMFDGQVDLIRDHYGVQPGEVDLPGFPLFALFNIAMQVTTVIPDMDPTRPANVNPLRILEAIENQGVTQAFGSPALWNRVGRHCEQHGITLPSLRRVLSAGAPVPVHVLQRMTKVLSPHADIFTPYGATECLPVASIGGRRVLSETAELTRQGRGTCVGTIFRQMQVKIIRTTFDPILTLADAEELPQGEIGEIIVKGPVATREYFRRADSTAVAKINDGNSFWHRMGDVGYLDAAGQLWFCGRRAHIVWTADGPMYSVCCEAIFNNHPDVYRSALVGPGERGQQVPGIVIEPEPGKYPETAEAVTIFTDQLLKLGAASELTKSIRNIYFHRSLPVDTRHNVKINRELLTEWVKTK